LGLRLDRAGGLSAQPPGHGADRRVRFTEALKQQWLPRLATGRGRLACLTLTEPGAGSDLQGGVRTQAGATATPG
jgi:alkylation response protein AidB-like acyl-CoA dehydrogenase